MGDRTASAYAILGLVLSAGGLALALARSRTAASFYAAEVYHLTRRSHRRFALLSASFSVAFVGSLFLPASVVPLLAVYVLLLVLYATSFARGFSSEDE